MPFSTGHKSPSGGGGETLGVEVVTDVDLVGMPEGGAELPVGVLEDDPETGEVELVSPVGTTDVELETVGPVLGSPVGELAGEVIEALEEEIVAVLLEDKETLVVDEVTRLEVSNVTVVVISSEIVPEVVPST